MKTKSYIVPNVSCSHCKGNIERELGQMAGVRSIVVVVDSKEAVIKYESPATSEVIEAAFNDIGYPAHLQ